MATINAVNTSLSGQTGTGSFVGSTSPTITTPIIGEIDDVNGNALVVLTKVNTAVNQVTLFNAVTGNPAIVSATGGDSNVILSLRGKGNNGAEVKGTSAADNANAGYVGEDVTATTNTVSLTSNSAKTITSISLTAGDWDVYGNLTFTAAGGTTITAIAGAISLVTNSLATNTSTFTLQHTFTTGNGQIVPTGFLRVNASVTTTVYLVGYSLFAVSTMTSSGTLEARRRR